MGYTHTMERWSNGRLRLMRPGPKNMSRWAHGACVLIPWLTVAWMAVLTLDLLQSGLGISVWRHDALYYLGSMDSKLREEGRWLTYLLFDLLKSIDGRAAWLTGLMFFSAFIFHRTR